MKRFSGDHESLDTELNIVPIIDAFVMLICFLLFTAAFTQLVFLEAKLTTNTAAAADKSRSEMDQFRLVVTFEDQSLLLATTGSEAKKVNISIPNVKGDYDFKTLHEQLIAMKSEYPGRFSADVEFKMKQQQSVNYEKITKALDSIRQLSDDEYGNLRVAQKKALKVELSGTEATQIVPESIAHLAASLASNDIAKNADQKVLFPDVALVGLN